jgi:DNA-binding beta-propeller fold protein YncE
VLDDRDDDFAKGRPHHDGLTFLAESGRELRGLREFNTGQSVSASHCVAIDPPRARVYICELGANRVTALDLRGRRLWRVDDIGADALAVDPRTGNLWCAVGPNLAQGETVVLDPEGKEIAAFPVRGIDMVYDAHTDGFWLVGYGITKLSREGETLFHKPREGWMCGSVAVDPTDGSVWIGERDHPDISRSANRLWHLDSRGAELQSMDLGKQDPFAVACDPRTGIAWVVNLRSEILRITRDGRRLAPIPVAADAIAISPSRKHIWVTTRTEILQLDDDGNVIVRVPFGADSGQSRLVAF